MILFISFFGYFKKIKIIMSHLIKTIFYIIITFLFQISLNHKTIYEVSEYFDIIKKMEISEEDSKNLINNL